jgi:hypothetical protein
MKQQFLWGGAAVILLGAAAAFFVVDYAYRHPTSMLARLGVAATFAGLNPNPLSDINTAVIGGPSVQRRRPVIEARITTPDRSNTGISTLDPAEETIEPIQVEAVPPATGEPPVDGEESEWKGEWRPMFERGTVEQIEQMPQPCPDDAVVPVEQIQIPKRMPYADEGVEECAPEDKGGPAMNLLRGLSRLRCGQSCRELWEAVEAANVNCESGGCLTWFEYCAPEQLPIMPTEVPQNEDGQDENAASGPIRKTEIIQLKWAKSADVVTAVETYIVNLVNIFSTIGQNSWLPELQRDVVLVGDPTTNKLILNVSPDNYEGLVNLIDEIDQSAQPAAEECEHGCGGGCRHGCGPRYDKPCWPPRSSFREGNDEIDRVDDKSQLDQYNAKDWLVDATTAKIESALEERRLSLALENVPLYNCIQAVREYLGNIDIVTDDKAIQEAGISMEQPVTLCVSGVTLNSALSQLLKNAGLTYVVEKQSITIRPCLRPLTPDGDNDK